MPQALLQCVTKVVLIPAAWHFPAYSCLWAPLTDSAGGPSVLVAVSTERSQPAHLTPQQGKRSVANERQEFTSHLGVAGERPLCRRCSNGQPAADRRVWGFGPCFCFCHYCATVEQKISEPEKETMNLPLKFMVPCWGVLDIYFLSFLYSVHWLFKCIVHKQRSKIIHSVPFIRYVLILQRNWVAELKWFPLSYNVILIFFFSAAAALYIYRNSCFLGNGLEGWGGKCFLLSRFMGAALLWLIVRVWVPEHQNKARKKRWGERKTNWDPRKQIVQ